MMKFLQRLGKSLMLPVACLPAAGIMLGIGYMIDHNGWGANNIIAAFLIQGGKAILDHMALLFAIGVSIGMSDDNDGTAALSGLVSWLLFTTLLSSTSVALYTGAEANAAFGSIENVFVGIFAGLIGAYSYNKFKNTKLPDYLGFFSGKRCVAIVSAGITVVATIPLYFIWPFLYGALVSFGKAIVDTGAVGAGLYGFFNRLLIPTGLHHALNNVFWFDLANINDLGNFWSGKGTYGTTGMYMSGFFPVMMFGLPGAALAMYHTAKTNKRKIAASLLGAAAFCAFLTGVTEPLEFSFMFLAPGLYLVHAILTGISCFIVALLPMRLGFNFSAGLFDYILSFGTPMAQNPWLLIPIGLAAFVIYYVVFRFVITKFNLKTPGREDDDTEIDTKATLSNNNFTEVAAVILEGLGGKGNISNIDNCITRLRVEIKDYTAVDEKKIKSAGIAGVIRPGKTSVQVIVGTQVQFVADEIKKMI
ncbi:N-acetylglucosamine-specific PTS transporter subunit IIBC [Anaerocolumna xylanovorans]|uniref:PTS system N-acetylglucosamine-specific IIB component, Glc family (TC 4.A.1.1.2)/PTS system N-acetylglucosamine-specific IIC component, Glc family (TC 4.A.1.1.2) n=1 Tax=Anaerocolumna xylanovorans DSM 12503 TaxID=1121345 RepID=A0A1M7Y531_9FIRM|nr:N-acetylglucosamine-specific PTS transporter subunit IIBC [Anaerocolumna xylanovorans]SHO47304.1 PTS system N-acetylglucosamine-specific IIB component, Glc family (TC 4.A.1.1.2)/PTS system N-acetylglucosamine-specific IIC component, Glc family (TC 4.A.1.1.2) [Anaerocolumna xylanovorans DSM 12503]